MRFSFWLPALVAAVAGGGVAHGQIAVVNAASFTPGAPVAPGSFAAMFGDHLCPQTANAGWIAPGQLPTTVAGCSVMVNGTPAMLQYVSPGQINLIVPPNLGPGSAAVVLNNGSRTLTGSMMIAAAAPGIFATNGMGMGPGAMANGVTWTTGPFSEDTNGQPTVLAMFVTGLDLSVPPSVSIAGRPAVVAWYGEAPNLAGLQQINVVLPPGVAGAGRVPVAVSSAGQTSNITDITILPTTAMMQGMPGWGGGMMVGENMPRLHELSYMALNPVGNTVLVTDEADDVVRVISLDSQTTTATITLPAGSQARTIAVDGAGRLAAVVLSAKGAVAVLDLVRNQVLAVAGTGSYPSHLAFAGSSLLVTNGASGTVSVIDTASGTISRTVDVGYGASAIASNGTMAAVANMQAGSISLIGLADDSVSTVTLPAGARPYQIALSGNRAIATTPMSNGLVILDLTTHAFASVDAGTWNAMGPGAVVADDRFAYVANMMSASVTMVDLTSAKVVGTFAVDPGPHALALNPARNQLLVLAEGTGTLDVVDLASYSVMSRINAADTERQGIWVMPLVSSMSPNSAPPGAAFTLTITGTGLQAVRGLEFEILSSHPGGGMMGGSAMGAGPGMMNGQPDANIQVTDLQADSGGTQITALVYVLANASAGTRQVRLQTDRANIMALMSSSLFTVTK